MECREIITNPICPACIFREMETWLAMEREGMLLRKIKRLKTKKKNEGSIQCIICKEPNVFICPHCFTEKAYNIIRKNANQKLIEQFLIFFNYDLR